MSSNHGKTEGEDQEALSADSDSEAEGRHDAAEGAKALVPHHQRKGESPSGEDDLKHLKQPNPRAACDSARLQNDRQEGHESTRKQPDADSKAQMWTRLSPTGELRTYDGNCMLKQDHETHSNIIAKTGPAASMTRNMLKPAEAEGVKNKMETEVRREGKRKQRKGADVSEIMYDSVSKPFHVSTLQSGLSTEEAYLCRKSASSKRDKKMRLEATADGSYKTETTHAGGHRTKRNPVTVNREPWR